MMVNISAVFQKGKIMKAVEICVHQKLKEWKMINILFYKDGLRAGAKPGFGIWSRSQSWNSQRAPKCSE